MRRTTRQPLIRIVTATRKTVVDDWRKWDSIARIDWATTIGWQMPRTLASYTPAWIDRAVDARKPLIRMLTPNPIVGIYRTLTWRQSLIGTMSRTYYAKKTSNPRHVLHPFGPVADVIVLTTS
jgi:hypothetical protein